MKPQVRPCPTLPWRLSRLACFPLLFSTVFAMGCSGDGGAGKSEVSGKVTLGDKPVAGDVVFVYSDNSEMMSPIGSDGKYIMTTAKPGQVKIYIKPPMSTSAGGAPMPKGGPEMPKEGPLAGGGGGVPPPAKYQSAAGSGLTYDVKAGKQVYDIPLQ